MESRDDWIDRCSTALLDVADPRLDQTDTDDIACDLWESERMRALAPEEAAALWAATAMR